jgi:hypothetical protein
MSTKRVPWDWCHVNLDQIRLAMGLGYGLQDGGVRYQRN